MMVVSAILFFNDWGGISVFVTDFLPDGLNGLYWLLVDVVCLVGIEGLGLVS